MFETIEGVFGVFVDEKEKLVADQLIGKTFGGRYQITERIGIGGMAEVYLAQDNVLGRLVAVKVMLPQYAADPTFTKRFRQEAASAANLQNPYIVNVYDWGFDDDTYYIVMEYVRGADLKSEITKNGRIEQKKAAQYGMQACQALATAHHQDIIHRDIKPQNIMVAQDGNIKVMDFGIAHAKNSMLTQTSSVLGTAHYISPEQAQGKELTPASDIYSLGIVLYEAVTGKLPFDGPDAVSVALQQVKEQPKPPSQIVPEIHPDLERIILKAMAKVPSSRFATARDMAEALSCFLQGRPVNFNNRAAAMAGIPTMNPSQQSMPQQGQMMGQPQNMGMNGMNGMSPNMNGMGNRPMQQMGQMNQMGQMGQMGQGGMYGNGYPMNGGMNQGVMQRPQVMAQPIPAGSNTVMPVAGYNSRNGRNNGRRTNVGPYYQQPKKGARTGKIAGIVFGAIAAVAAVGALVYVVTSNLNINPGEETTKVPNVLNMTYEEAEAAILEAGFVVGEVTYEYSSSKASDIVISQTPHGNTNNDKGSEVSLTISKGSQKIEVPDLSRMTASEARNALITSGLRYATGTSAYSDTITKDLVLSQDPVAGTQVDLNSTVTVCFSLGKESIILPSVVGQTKEEATTLLEQLGLIVSAPSTKEVYSDDIPEGQVVEQSIAEGESAHENDVVTLTISKGPAPRYKVTVTLQKVDAHGNPYEYENELSPYCISVYKDPAAEESEEGEEGSEEGAGEGTEGEGTGEGTEGEGTGEPVNELVENGMYIMVKEGDKVTFQISQEILGSELFVHKATYGKYNYEYKLTTDNTTGIISFTTGAIKEAENITVQIKYFIGWQVTLDANEGTFSEGKSTLTVRTDLQGAFTIPETPTRHGYKFTGWMMGETLTTDVNKVSDDTTLVAQWEEISYTITLNANGGTFSNGESTMTVKTDCEGAFTIPETPTLTGMYFQGWQLGQTILGGTIPPVSEDTTLTALWGSTPPGE